MDLKELSAPLPKPWLNIKAHTLIADTVTAASFVGPVISSSITLPNSAPPPNPSAGNITLYSNVSGNLSTQDSIGNSVPYVPITGAQMVGDIDMNANSLLRVLTLSGATNTRTGDNIVSNSGASTVDHLASFVDVTGKVIQDSGLDANSMVISASVGISVPSHIVTFLDGSGVLIQDSGSSISGSDVNLGPGTISVPGSSNIIIDVGSGSCTAGSANGVVIGVNDSVTGQFSTAIGTNIVSTAATQLNLGGGNTGITNSQPSSVALGDNITLAGGSFGIAIGNTASLAAGASVAIGASAASLGVNDVVIGSNTSTGAGGGSVSIGNGTTVTGLGSLGICGSALASGDRAIAICAAHASGNDSIAMGSGATATAPNSFALGAGSANGTANTCVIGDASIASISPGSVICDLGLNARPFASARLGALRLVTGANKTVGSGAVLVGGSVVVATTAVSAGDLVLLSRTAVGGTPGNLYISAISASVSFTVTSDSALDTSTVSWMIVKQA